MLIPKALPAKHNFTSPGICVINEPRYHSTDHSNASAGHVHRQPIKSAWITGMSLITLFGGYHTFSFSNVLLFAITTGTVLCLGHSLGMHRRLIHNSYACPNWLEKVLVWLGALVGLGGPTVMIKTHDIRDWAQRQPDCHDYFAHRQSFLRDAFWQMHCDVTLHNPPKFELEERVKQDSFYQFLDQTWMLQQLPVALIFFIFGGWDWVIWGICARVAVSVTGHWLVGYFAHRQGHRDWHIEGAGVQGHNVKYMGLLTFGECWHNNHHAFPGSAKLGLYKGQIDPGWWVLKVFEQAGLAWDIKTPVDLPFRKTLKRITS